MNEYGYKVISCPKLDYNFINNLNFNELSQQKIKIAIQVKNTKYIDKEALLYLKKMQNKYNLDIKISVIGPYTPKKENSPETKERHFYNTLYEIDELYKIIQQFEKIEEMMDPKWNVYDKVVFLIETIARNIMYDPEYLLMKNKGLKIPLVEGKQDKADYYDRSLRGMLTRKAVCAGFSIIFKELANRNNIECKYVSGLSYGIDGSYRGGHAWNLVKINGIIYPVDVTRKNTKYRAGDFKNVDQISCDIEEFKKTHKPHDPKDNEGLTKMDEQVVKNALKKTVIRKHYNSTTYTIQRTNKTKFIIAQIGMYKGLYRYLYAEIKEDGSYGIPKILFSESNLVKEINDHRFEFSNHYYQFIKSFADVLLSKENIEDSERMNTKYIGSCEIKDEKYVKNVKDIKKREKEKNAFSINYIKTKKRIDGSYVTIVQFPNKNNNGYSYEYYVYVLSQGPMLLEYHIYSNTNYFEISPQKVVESLLSDENLRQTVENGGYIK